MHLADRRGGERLLVELEEQPLDRLAELLLDHALDLRERERPHVVLEAAQLGDDVRRDDVGARREQLAELDERRPELVEHLAQVAAARRRRPPTAASADLRPSNTYPKPCRTATCAISPRRPMLRCFGRVATPKVLHEDWTDFHPAKGSA